MTLFDHIKSVLEQNESFCKDGKLFKNTVVEAGLKLAPELLKLLLKDDKAKKHFFTEVDGIAVFDKTKFQKFVSNKQFLPDSFTAFKNKIGLTANGEYLTEANEVVLDFPYKDCVLEGGQTKEDQKRQEIFWNETLAPDEIDRLFEPKVLCNWKKFSSDKEETNFDIGSNENFVLKGNNLIALHSLLPVYKNSIKLIYIDPPYNTGNDSFNYNDNFNHSSWLTFMKNRLVVAKKLLTNDGAIAISCDDNEQAYLKVMCDEIFGNENFQSCITNIVKPEGRNYGNVAKSHEYVLLYSKTTNFETNEVEVVGKKFKYTDSVGGYNLKELRNGNSAFHVGNRPNLFYPIYIDINSKDKNGFYKVLPSKTTSACEVLPKKTKGIQTVWRWGRDKVVDSINDLVGKETINGSFSIYQKTRKSTTKIKSVWNDKEFYTLKGNQELESLLGAKQFSNPKPEALISYIIEMCTNEGDIVLDYHFGSGTTGSVAMKMKRLFIGIEQMDYINSVTVNRLKKALNGDDTFVSEKYDWKGGSSFIYAELTTAFSLIAKVQATNSESEIKSLLNDYSSVFNYKLIKAKIFENDLGFDELKKICLSLIDPNQIYVPFSDIDDDTFGVDANTKQLNNKFYANF